MRHILFFLFFPLLLQAQDNNGGTPPVTMRSISPEQWDKAAKGLDYSKDLPKPVKERKQKPIEPSGGGIDWTGLTQGWGVFFQSLAILIAVLGIGYGIYRMMQEPRNRTISRDGVEITVENVDAYLHESDLDRFLREALAAGNFSLAVRLYYLQVIKTLSEQNAIAWSREKTNRDYQREMRQHRLSRQFKSLTRAYEQVWYGNLPIDAKGFAKIEPEFKDFLAGI